MKAIQFIVQKEFLRVNMLNNGKVLLKYWSNLMEVKVIGQMDNTIDHTFESANRVYDVGGGISYNQYLRRWWIATEDFRRCTGY